MSQNCGMTTKPVIESKPNLNWAKPNLGWAALPTELIERVVANLAVCDLIVFAMVCKAWHEVSSNNSTWQTIYTKRVCCTATTTMLGDRPSWKRAVLEDFYPSCGGVDMDFPDKLHLPRMNQLRLQSHAATHRKCCKIVLVGGHGKTTFMHRFCHRQPPRQRRYHSWGTEVELRRIYLKESDDTLAITMVDPSRNTTPDGLFVHFDYNTFNPVTLQMALAVLVMVDLTDDNSFVQVRNQFLPDIVLRLKSLEMTDTQILLVGTKVDLVDLTSTREQQSQKLAHLAAEFGVNYQVCSCVTGEGVDRVIRRLVVRAIRNGFELRWPRPVAEPTKTKEKSWCTSQ